MAMETTFCDFHIAERILVGHFIELIRYLWWNDSPTSSWERMVENIANKSSSQITTQGCKMKTEPFSSFSKILQDLSTKIS